MLVRLGSADSVPIGQRIVPARSVARPTVVVVSCSARVEPMAPVSGAVRLLQGELHAAPGCTSTGSDVPAELRARAQAAYRASELIQPRPGLILHVRA